MEDKSESSIKSSIGGTGWSHKLVMSVGPVSPEVEQRQGKRGVEGRRR